MDRLEDMRRESRGQPLLESSAEADPIKQFALWFDQAVRISQRPWLEPNAMVLGTVSPEGWPSARVVLLKHFDDSGFVFYTHHASRKGRELAGNPRVSLVFYWGDLERSVRVQGLASRLDLQDSSRYFASRPRQSQLSALASEQSHVIPDRPFLENRLAELARKHEGQEVPMPAGWGGYLVSPIEMEFWQGRPDRLHDRLVYTRNEAGQWIIRRLAP